MAEAVEEKEKPVKTKIKKPVVLPPAKSRHKKDVVEDIIRAKEELRKYYETSSYVVPVRKGRDVEYNVIIIQDDMTWNEHSYRSSTIPEELEIDDKIYLLLGPPALNKNGVPTFVLYKDYLIPLIRSEMSLVEATFSGEKYFITPKIAKELRNSMLFRNVLRPTKPKDDYLMNAMCMVLGGLIASVIFFVVMNFII